MTTPQPEPKPAVEDSLPTAPDRSLRQLFVLKEGDSFLVADAFGDVTGEGDGFFHDDTRQLSAWRVLINGTLPTLLSSAVSQDNVYFSANLTNRPLPALGETSTPQGVLHMERRRLLWDGRIYERITVHNYSDAPVQVPLQIRFAADFRDMFEVRGVDRARRGRLGPGEVDGCRVTLGYEGLDEVHRAVVLSFAPMPAALSAREAGYRLELGPRASWQAHVEIGADGAQPDAWRFRRAAAQARFAMRQRRHSGARLQASGRLFQGWIDKSEADLALLTTMLPSGPYPYAGIPWFSTPFGRDAVITSLQTLWLQPRLAAGVLAFLASHQAHEVSAFRDAEPGKIMHETRKGEMAAVEELPFGRYYGGVDTTPLFLVLATAYLRRTGDLGLIRSIWPALCAAMRWIEHNMAAHGGLLSYARAQASGLANQGWKDSHDAVFHADGSTPSGPIALVEVQGYCFQAFQGMAALGDALDHGPEARRWAEAADELARRVEAAYWLDDLQFYAMALDGDSRPCRVRASNAGHLLYCGLPAPARGRAVARQLMSNLLNSGWGTRTLATEATRYNPMSYHNGSVWPHDVALCAAGIGRYADRAEVVRLVDQLFAAASHFGLRLPELFCGFDRAAGEAPVAYPVACQPQAWASGAVFMLLQACLGLEIDAPGRTVVVEHQRLPPDAGALTIRRLAVGDDLLDLHFQRQGERTVVFANPDGRPHRTEIRLHL